MKKFRFCALCLILAALLSACGGQGAQGVPGAAAVPSPAAVPEIPAESTSTPSPPHRPGGSREGVAGADQGDGCSKDSDFIITIRNKKRL